MTAEELESLVEAVKADQRAGLRTWAEAAEEIARLTEGLPAVLAS